MASCSFSVPLSGGALRRNPEKILVLVSARIGDVIFATPALRLLRTVKPVARIDVLARSESGVRVLENNPHVNSAKVLPSLKDFHSFSKTYSLIICLHDNQVTQEYIESLGDFQSFPLDLHEGHQCEGMVSIVQQAMNYTANFTDDMHYELYPQPDDFSYVQNVLKEQGVVKTDILIGCQCGCHTVAKRGWKFWKPMRHPKIWPLDRFIELERRLSARNSHVRMVLTGSQGEKIFGKKFKKQSSRVINLIGKTTILQLAALMKSCRVLITPDTAPLHIACAMNIPIVAFHGPTSPAHTGAYPHRPHNIVIHKDSVEHITVDDVEQAVLSLL